MYTCPLHQWQSSDYPCPACHQTVTTTEYMVFDPIIDITHLPTPEVGSDGDFDLHVKPPFIKTNLRLRSPEVGKTMIDVLQINNSRSEYNTEQILKAMSEWAAIKCEAKDAEIKELREALENLIYQYKLQVEYYAKQDGITWDSLCKHGLPAYQQAKQALNQKL